MADLARRAQVDANTFSEWKTKGKHPSPGTLKAVAAALGTTERRLWDAYEGTAEAGGGVTDSPDLAAALMRQAEAMDRHTAAMESFARIQRAQTDALVALTGLVGQIREDQIDPEDWERAIAEITTGRLPADTVEVADPLGRASNGTGGHRGGPSGASAARRARPRRHGSA